MTDPVDPGDGTPEARAFRAAAAQEAVGELVQRIDHGAMATKFVLLIETVDLNGDQGFWTLASDGIAAWESVGMLQHALHLESAAVVRERFDS